MTPPKLRLRRSRRRALPSPDDPLLPALGPPAPPTEAPEPAPPGSAERAPDPARPGEPGAADAPDAEARPAA